MNALSHATCVLPNNLRAQYTPPGLQGRPPVSHHSSMLALAVSLWDQQGFSSRISLLKFIHVAVNKERPSHYLSVFSFSGYPQHTPAMLSVTWVLAALN
jgi:hypothetical protein